ncbi:hypothetical protein B484DRAFT_458303 [Ochromonadaceae sp. CCMP2298]|nr:hypothetical protein B484DRAFT_458303 [Ochromonadaceae sp. CCMP2298]|mmetsp:Transcript_13260/g.29327  ORF Transcript_13260/g.29327 Transcript_13260/m.29327 type:complete len:333 (-) Transcript_13260:97-1095(-)
MQAPVLWLVFACASLAICVEAFSFFNNALLPLRNEAEMLIDADSSYEFPADIKDSVWVTELLKTRREATGREAVGESIATIQRLMLQLDRSDGRPDIKPDLLALKFNNFLGTCLRTEGAAWTAALGPLEYVGVRMDQHVSDVDLGDQRIRIIDTTSLCTSMCKCLIDLDLDAPDSVKKIAAMDDEQLRNVLDLSMALTRLALRYAISKEQLESHEVEAPTPSEDFSSEDDPEVVRMSQSKVPQFTIKAFDQLELASLSSQRIGSDLEGVPVEGMGGFSLQEKVFLKPARFSALLQYDLNVDADDLPIKGSSRVLVHKFGLEAWAKENKLTPK